MENSIIADLKDSYGINCNQITPVTGGWLNQKWKVSNEILWLTEHWFELDALLCSE